MSVSDAVTVLESLLSARELIRESGCDHSTFTSETATDIYRYVITSVVEFVTSSKQSVV